MVPEIYSGAGSCFSRSSPQNAQVVVSRVDYTSFLPCREWRRRSSWSTSSCTLTPYGKVARKCTPWWLVLRWLWCALTTCIWSPTRFWTRNLLLLTVWYRMDRGYHRHTLNLWGGRATPWCCKDWRSGWFRCPWRRRFCLRGICETRANFSAPSQNLHAIIKKDLFYSCSAAGGRNNYPSHVCAHYFDHRYRCAFYLSWLGIYHPSRFIHSRQSIRQLSFLNSKWAVEAAIFGGRSGTTKELGDESSYGQRLTQAFRVVRGVLRSILDACQTPRRKNLTKETNSCAKN